MILESIFNPGQSSYPFIMLGSQSYKVFKMSRMYESHDCFIQRLLHFTCNLGELCPTKIYWSLQKDVIKINITIQNGRQLDDVIYFQRQHVAPNVDPSNADHQLTRKDGLSISLSALAWNWPHQQTISNFTYVLPLLPVYQKLFGHSIMFLLSHMDVLLQFTLPGILPSTIQDVHCSIKDAHNQQFRGSIFPQLRNTGQS